MSKPLNDLRLDHANFMKLLAVMEQELSVFERGETPDYEILLKVAEYFSDYAERYHHPLENKVFAKLRERDPGAADAVGDLELEHQATTGEVAAFKEVAEAVLREAELPRGILEEKARNFIDKERAHIAMEEQLFFPAARKALTPEDWAAVSGELTLGKDPLFSNDSKVEFRELADVIRRWEQEAQEARTG